MNNFLKISSAKISIGGDCATVRSPNWLSLSDARGEKCFRGV